MLFICFGDMALLQMLHNMSKKRTQARNEYKAFKNSVYEASNAWRWGFFHSEITSHAPFTSGWIAAWEKRTQRYALKKWQVFLTQKGLESLETLARRNAN